MKRSLSFFLERSRSLCVVRIHKPWYIIHFHLLFVKKYGMMNVRLGQEIQALRRIC